MKFLTALLAKFFDLACICPNKWMKIPIGISVKGVPDTVGMNNVASSDLQGNQV